MNKAKRARLEAAGWRVGSTPEFLDLRDGEAAFVEMKLALSAALRTQRTPKGLSQAELAKRLHSSQSRVAKMEAGEGSVSVDLLVRGLLALGATPRAVARAIEGRRRPAAA